MSKGMGLTGPWALAAAAAVAGAGGLWWIAQERAPRPEADAPEARVSEAAPSVQAVAPLQPDAAAPGIPSPVAADSIEDPVGPSEAPLASSEPPRDSAAEQASLPAPVEVPEKGAAQTSAPDAAAPPPDATEPQSAATPAPDTASAPTPAPEPDTGNDAAAVTSPPGFDLVRVDAMGGALIAGTAPALFEVSVDVDGIEHGHVRADGAGSFATLFDLPVSEAPQVLTLIARGPAGQELRSEGSVVLAPRPPLPVVSAEAGPDPLASVLRDPAPEIDRPGAGPGLAFAPSFLAPRETAPVETAPGFAASEPIAAVSSEAGAAPGGGGTDPLANLSRAQPTAVGAVSAVPGRTSPVSPGAVSPGAVSPGAVSGASATPPTTAAPDPAATVVATGSAPAAAAERAATQTALASVAERAATDTAPTAAAERAEPAAQGASPALSEAGAAEALSRPEVSRADAAVAPALQGLADPAAGPAATARAPAVLLVDAQGVRLLEPGRAQAATGDRVSVQVISYADDGSVVLEGGTKRPPPVAREVRVYIDNAPIEAVEIAEDGSWRTPLPPVASGVYTLRVDQIDEAGQVISRFETPFKREDPEDLARIAPAEGADGVSASLITVQPGYTLWGIAADRYGAGRRYVQVFEANRSQIRDPDLIYPGQVFTLPEP